MVLYFTEIVPPLGTAEHCNNRQYCISQRKLPAVSYHAEKTYLASVLPKYVGLYVD